MYSEIVIRIFFLLFVFVGAGASLIIGLNLRQSQLSKQLEQSALRSPQRHVPTQQRKAQRVVEETLKSNDESIRYLVLLALDEEGLSTQREHSTLIEKLKDILENMEV